jgi:hypothetical protein
MSILDLRNGLFLDLQTGQTFQDRRSGQDRRILDIGPIHDDLRNQDRRDTAPSIPSKAEVLYILKRDGIYCY